MEPRISSLLVDPRMLDRNLFEHAGSTLTPSKPSPVEPSHVRDELRIRQNNNLVVGGIAHDFNHTTGSRATKLPLQPLRPRSAFIVSAQEGDSKHGYDGFLGSSTNSAKSAAPLAVVLNSAVEPDNSAAAGGSLQDLLLEAPRKRRKIDQTDGAEETRLRNNNNHLLNGPANKVTLPKPQPAKRSPRRQRIPPLLQGLHQPPPDAGLFPRITDRQEEKFKNTSNVNDDEERAPLPENQPTKDPCTAIASPNTTSIGDGTAKDAKKAIPVSLLYAKDEKKKAKRRKWSGEETTDLLQGVARFGIGSWAKILAYSEYKFDNRTPVDLKDRFRTCCPDYYRNFRSGQKLELASVNIASEASETVSIGLQMNCLSKEIPEKKPIQREKGRKPRSDHHRKNAADLAELGIKEPFKQNERRKRREFSKAEDDALLKGYLKHGPRTWHLIRKDASLALGHRTPTDLRDRFRNRYPERYSQSGYIVRAKEVVKQISDQETSGEIEPLPGQTVPQSESCAIPTSVPSIPAPAQTISQRSHQMETSKHMIPHSSRGQDQPLMPLLTNLPGVYLPSPSTQDVGSDDDYSPVVLSRNIIQWAGANLPSSSISTTQSSTQQPEPIASLTTNASASHRNCSTNGNATVASEGLLINLQGMPINPPTQLIATNTLTLPVIWKKGSCNHNLPLLPTLSLPATQSIPNSIAGSNTAYLPPPADLLSAIDFDGARETQHTFWDDSSLPP